MNSVDTYFDKIKDFPDYAGKKDAKSALRHMISYGLSKTFKAYEKKGYIIDGQVEKMKEWANMSPYTLKYSKKNTVELFNINYIIKIMRH